MASVLFSERIWPKVDTSGGTNACWPWLGSRTQRGYGMLSWAGKPAYVHRLVFERHNGLIPQGFDVHHTCENAPCCNPRHLQAVTHAANVKASGPRMARWGNRNRAKKEAV